MILAIDPGLTTGWAGWNTIDKAGFSSGMVEGGRFAFYEWFYRMLSGYYAKDAASVATGDRVSAYGSEGVIWMTRPFTLVMERFTITQATARKSPQPDPYLIIGHVEALCHRDGINYIEQGPSEAMSFATNDKLKAVNWYKPGKGHDNDAARHLMLYMVKNKIDGGHLLKQLAESLGVVQ